MNQERFSRWLNHLTPIRFYLLIGPLFGMLFILLTPPFQVPDEINHFYRAFHIAEGHVRVIKTDNRLGGLIPVSATKIVEPFY